ncbi:hypothetical protein OEZ85_004848 [Tetradesmus obliquus]|uniref:GYF domain-containing protein n=1 Tax=Tetradesmus obliquus TaxID=3088 RepID=A0ABY8UG16_TETOB|nr:hypothetical protein OEZ85_004848 [Tetradesmus obliquus]
MELEVLRSQLQLETSARKEHEVQCAAKTRQLWQLREQHEREAPSIDWYHLEEGGSVRGPHDATLMIRWFCSFFLEDHLPVAGVLQQPDGSSRQPPGAVFQPLHVLLALVQQGGSYLPHNSMPAGRASVSQLLLAMPASPPPRHVLRAQQQQQQQQQDDSTLPSSSKLFHKEDAGNGSSSSGVDSRSKSSSGGWGIQAVQDALDSVGSAVEGLAMQVAEGLDSLDSMASAAAAGLAADDVAAGGEGVAAEGSSSALDFLSDFPQLVPAAVMSDGAQQRHSAAGQQQQQGAAQLAAAGAASEIMTGSAKSLSTGLAEQQQQPALTSGAVADMSEFAAEAVRQVRSVVAAAQLPGVWRVESLHQMLRAVSPEPGSRTAAAAGKGGR